MHEASIARRVIELAEAVAREHPGRPLTVVRVRVGAFQSIDAFRIRTIPFHA